MRNALYVLVLCSALGCSAQLGQRSSNGATQSTVNAATHRVQDTQPILADEVVPARRETATAHSNRSIGMTGATDSRALAEGQHKQSKATKSAPRSVKDSMPTEARGLGADSNPFADADVLPRTAENNGTAKNKNRSRKSVPGWLKNSNPAEAKNHGVDSNPVESSYQLPNPARDAQQDTKKARKSVPGWLRNSTPPAARDHGVGSNPLEDNYNFQPPSYDTRNRTYVPATTHTTNENLWRNQIRNRARFRGVDNNPALDR